MQIHAHSIVSRVNEATFNRVDDELLAFDERAEYVYALNESAGRVWELIEQPTSVSAVCARLRQDYTVDEATCLREVIELLQGLYEAGLVQVSDGSAG